MEYAGSKDDIRPMSNIVQMLGAILYASAVSESVSATVETIHYCTIDGPVHLSIEGSRFAARYRISRRKIDGTIDGSITGNMVAGRWKDSWGTGPIYIFFSEDRTKFVTAYHEDRRPEHWYGPWSGARADTVGAAPDTGRLICS